MKLNKAIEILEITRQENPDDLDPHTWNATMLGLEAMKHIEKSRRFGDLWALPVLPGEDPE